MDELKAVIRSILTSTTSVLTIQQLSKDYRNTIGGPVPYQKFGFNSLEHMMRSIPDVVCVRGSGPFAELIVVQSDKSAHIDHLVSKQKTTVKKRQSWCYNTPRRTVPHFAYNNKPAPGHSVNIQYQSHPTPPSMGYPSHPIPPSMGYPSHPIPPLMGNKTQSPPIVTKESSQTHNSKPSNTFKQQSEPAASLSNKSAESHYQPKTSHHTFPQSKQKSLNLPKLNHLHSSETSTQKLQNFELNKENLEKLQQLLNLSDNSSSNDTNMNPMKLENKDKVKDYTNVDPIKLENKDKVKDDLKPPIESAERHIPYTVKHNLKTLIEKYPEGIWCAEVPAIYKKNFRSELRYQELGFRSLIELCSSLPSIFHYVRPSTGDFKLYYKNRPLPDNAEKTFTIASYQSESTTPAKDEALPSFDWKDIEYLLPSDIVNLGEEIPREFISDTTQVNDDIEVGRGEVYDLSKFWVYVNNGALDELMENLQNFYNGNAEKYHIPKNVIIEGLYCVQLFDEEYHRALIIKLIDAESVKVVFIDYGTTSEVPTSGLYFLHKNFAKLSAQAIRCRLASIQPLVGGAPWSVEAVYRFRELFVSYRSFTAKIMRIDRKSMALDIYLWDNNNASDNLYVNDQLVKEGLAIYSDQTPQKMLTLENCKVKHLHLFPTFEELECGLSPSTTEMEVMQNSGLILELIYPQYFEHEHSEELKRIEETEKFFEEHFHETNMKRPPVFEKHAERVPFNFDIFSGLEGDIRDYIGEENETENEHLEVLNSDKSEEKIDSKHVVNVLNSDKSEEKIDSKRMLNVMDELTKDCLEIFKDISAFSQMNLEERIVGSSGSSMCENLDELRDELGSITEDVVNLTGLSLEDMVAPSEECGSRIFDQNLEQTDLCSENPFTGDSSVAWTDTPLVLDPCNPFLTFTGTKEEHGSEPSTNNIPNTSTEKLSPCLSAESTTCDVVHDMENINSHSTYSEDNSNKNSESGVDSDYVIGEPQNDPYHQSGGVQFAQQTPGYHLPPVLPHYYPQYIYPYHFQYPQYGYPNLNLHIQQYSEQFFSQRSSSVPIPPGFTASTVGRNVAAMNTSMRSAFELNTNILPQGDFYEKYNELLRSQLGGNNS